MPISGLLYWIQELFITIYFRKNSEITLSLKTLHMKYCKLKPTIALVTVTTDESDGLYTVSFE